MHKKLILPTSIISSIGIYSIYNLKNADNIKIEHKKTNILKNDSKSKTILSVSKFIQPRFLNDKINTYENEKKWLNILKETDVIAKPIHFDDNNKIITTEYVGERINKNNIPNDYEDQLNNIIKELEKHNCRHNDIKPEELLVMNGKIKVVDFGWANELNEDNPDYWPKLLGSKFKCVIEKDKDVNIINSNKGFDDKCSIIKSIKYIFENKD
jgi:tRNA A-37 threonylcarbamoyl transferase component Bud32